MKFFLSILTGVILLLPTTVVFAANTVVAPGTNTVTAPGTNNTSSLENPLAGGSSLCDLLNALFSIAVQIAIPIAVVFLVIAGLKFVLARGNPTGLSQAKANLMWTLIGIALFFGAWFLAQVIARTLVELGSGSNGNNFNTCFLSK